MPPTQAAIDAASAEPPVPLEIHESQFNRIVIHPGRRFRIRTAPGETRALTIAFTGELPFVEASGDPQQRRSTAAPFPSSRTGIFPFDCFLNDVQVTVGGYAGEIEIVPQP